MVPVEICTIRDTTLGSLRAYSMTDTKEIIETPMEKNGNGSTHYRRGYWHEGHWVEVPEPKTKKKVLVVMVHHNPDHNKRFRTYPGWSIQNDFLVLVDEDGNPKAAHRIDANVKTIVTLHVSEVE